LAQIPTEGEVGREVDMEVVRETLAERLDAGGPAAR